MCVGFDRTSYVVVEEVGHVLVCVRVLCPGQPVRRDVSVQLTTASNTASMLQTNPSIYEDTPEIRTPL